MITYMISLNKLLRDTILGIPLDVDNKLTSIRSPVFDIGLRQYYNTTNNIQYRLYNSSQTKSDKVKLIFDDDSYIICTSDTEILVSSLEYRNVLHLNVGTHLETVDYRFLNTEKRRLSGAEDLRVQSIVKYTGNSKFIDIVKSDKPNISVPVSNKLGIFIRIP